MISQHAKSIRDTVTKLFEAGQFENGISELERWGAALPVAVRFECYGNLFFYRRELQEAIEKYEAAIAADPTYQIARYHYLVGTQDEKNGSYVDTFTRYQAAIDVDPSFLDAYIELGGLLVRVGDFEGAARCYRDAIKIAPNDLSCLHNFKVVLSELSKFHSKEFQEELTATSIAYDKLVAEGKTLPLHHQW